MSSSLPLWEPERQVDGKIFCTDKECFNFFSSTSFLDDKYGKLIPGIFHSDTHLETILLFIKLLIRIFIYKLSNCLVYKIIIIKNYTLNHKNPVSCLNKSKNVDFFLILKKQMIKIDVD